MRAGYPVAPTGAAIIVAAGRGTRLGTADKVFLPLAGRPLLVHVLDAVERAATIRDVVLVVAEHTRSRAAGVIAVGLWRKPIAVVLGGERRQDSVAAGLQTIAPDIEIVAVHDAARPLVTPALFDAAVTAAAAAGAAVTAVPVADTLKRVADGRIIATVSRDGLWAAQTPQAFRVDLLRRAFAVAADQDLSVTDEAALFEALGRPVAVVLGSPANLKITRPADLAIAEALLAHAAAPTDAIR